jgi:hypothetical protein
VKDRPRIVLPIEWLHSGHAMYRCWADCIAALGERFELIAIARRSVLDEPARSLFDRVIALEDANLSINEAVRHITECEPDVVYYPSVGMDGWCIALASVRLAPIQVFTLGHPATTKSEAMDYVLLPELSRIGPDSFSETAVAVAGLGSMVMHSRANFPLPRIKRHPEVMRVAISAMAAKISVPFLQACRQVALRSRRKLVFQVFSGLRGVNWLRARKQISDWLPNTTVYAEMPYNEYLTHLAECDVLFSTFPFGGTNTNIDAMKLAIPFITLYGEETHGQIDALMMRMAGMPDWLITQNASEYESAALRLLTRDEERCAIAKRLADIDVDTIFKDRGFTADFRDAFYWLYREHECIQAEGRRFWTVEDRRMYSARASS